MVPKMSMRAMPGVVPGMKKYMADLARSTLRSGASPGVHAAATLLPIPLVPLVANCWKTETVTWKILEVVASLVYGLLNIEWGVYSRESEKGDEEARHDPTVVYVFAP